MDYEEEPDDFILNVSGSEKAFIIDFQIDFASFHRHRFLYIRRILQRSKLEFT